MKYAKLTDSNNVDSNLSVTKTQEAGVYYEGKLQDAPVFSLAPNVVSEIDPTSEFIGKMLVVVAIGTAAGLILGGLTVATGGLGTTLAICIGNALLTVVRP